jgi:predicted HTH transcriptional regulator
VAYGRISESLSPLSLHEIEQIRRQITLQDWSAQICEGAEISDLDPQAIEFARLQYKEKNKNNPHLASEVDQWDDVTFLNKSKVCIYSKITRAAIILLGKSEAEHFIYPAIAHQDYTKGGRINVVEEAESLFFTNVGEFIPGSVEEAIRRDAPPEIYQNRFLAEAMVNLNMIDTIGSGIKRMFLKQRERSFPMPDYNLTEPERVRVRIIGKILDERYTRMLMTRTDLDLMAVIALDKVQKDKPITDDEFKSLKKNKLIEGRRSNLFVSAKVAAATDTKADYIKRRGIDKEYSKKLVIDYLAKFKETSRQEINQILLDKLSDSLSYEQKKLRIRNLLQEMRTEGTIEVLGRGPRSKWILSKTRYKSPS